MSKVRGCSGKASEILPHRPEGPQHVAELQVQLPRPTGDQPVRTQWGTTSTSGSGAFSSSASRWATGLISATRSP